MFGIYVKNTREMEYAKAIVNNYKPMETRSRNVFKSIIGEHVAVITKGYIIGYVTIESVKHYNQAEFRKMFMAHLVPPGSRYDSTEQGKYCYLLSNPVALEKPIPVPKDRINHGRSYCEF